MKTFIILAAFVLLFIPQLATAQGNIVINGSFDTNALEWTLSNGSSYGSVYGLSGGGVLLDALVPAFSTDPTASQTINGLIPGAMYTISGYYQKQKDRGTSITPSNEDSFGVGIDGNFLFEAASSTNIDLNWYGFSFLYTANSSSAILSLSSQINGTGVSYCIDNISMEAVPEPSALWIFGVGVLFLYGRVKWPNPALEATATAHRVSTMR